jgi:DUF3040 family protein
MSLSHHHQRQLYRIESGLLRADPQLAAMLGIFGKLSAGLGHAPLGAGAHQAGPRPAGSRTDRAAVTLVVQEVTLAAAAVGLLLRAVLALVIVVAGTPHRHRRPAPGPERTRRGRGTDGYPDPAGQS